MTISHLRLGVAAIALAFASTVLSSAPTLADPPPWAKAHGWRDKHHGDDDDDDGPRVIVTQPPPVVVAPAPAPVYVAPPPPAVVYETAPPPVVGASPPAVVYQPAPVVAPSPSVDIVFPIRLGH